MSKEPLPLSGRQTVARSLWGRQVRGSGFRCGVGRVGVDRCADGQGHNAELERGTSIADGLVRGIQPWMVRELGRSDWVCDRHV